MTSAARHAHLLRLGAHVREEICNHLQAILVGLLDLAPVGKQRRWAVTGTQFRPVHELDELADSCRVPGSASDGTPQRAGVTDVAAVIYELLDAHQDTAEIAAELDSDRWRAHLEYLRALHRKGRELLAEMCADQVV